METLSSISSIKIIMSKVIVVYPSISGRQVSIYYAIPWYFCEQILGKSKQCTLAAQFRQKSHEVLKFEDETKCIA